MKGSRIVEIFGLLIIVLSVAGYASDAWEKPARYAPDKCDRRFEISKSKYQGTKFWKEDGEELAKNRRDICKANH